MPVRWACQALTAALLLLLPGAASAQVERFAVVVGNDLGDPPDVPLRYAEMDAARMASVLQEVGGVRPENVVLLQGKDADTVRRALIAVNERVRSAGRQTVLLVYYSGHADSTALHLRPEPPQLGELEQLVRGWRRPSASGILDSCRSGALTRVKGGTPIPPFEIQIGERVAGEGAVFLTSSSASEDSQESDELKGSFFTHALVSGLLGAADENGDGRITLDEAYRHAYEATLRGSSRTVAGIQHPTFQYDVRGAGDLVLATLEQKARGRAWLELPPGRTWLLFQDSADGPVVGEVGNSDRVRRLSLRAGRYFLRGRAPDVLLEGTVDLKPGTTGRVDESTLSRTAYAKLVRKGEGAPPTRSWRSRSRPGCAPPGERRGPLPGAAVGFPVSLRSITLTPGAWCRSSFSQHRPLLHQSASSTSSSPSATSGISGRSPSSSGSRWAGRSSTGRSTPAARRRHAPPGHCSSRPIWSSATTSGRRATSSPGWRRRLSLPARGLDHRE